MGYTHYWYREQELSADAMEHITADFSRIIKNLPVEAEIVDMPEYWNAPGDIAFAGKNGTGESMIFCRVSSAGCITPDRAREPWKAGKCFESCKTGMLPYDLAAASLLIIAKKHLPEDVRIFSDGSSDKWEQASGLCRRILGYGGTVVSEEREFILTPAQA
jgi:hypothetical protein